MTLRSVSLTRVNQWSLVLRSQTSSSFRRVSFIIAFRRRIENLARFSPSLWDPGTNRSFLSLRAVQKWNLPITTPDDAR